MNESRNKKDITTYPTPPHNQIEEALARFDNYHPQSTLISMQKLKESPYLCLKKFRDGVFYGEIVNGKRHGMGIMIIGERVY